MTPGRASEAMLLLRQTCSPLDALRRTCLSTPRASRVARVRLAAASPRLQLEADEIPGGRSPVPRASFRDGGYTLVAIMIFMTLLAISILIISPAISKIMQRDHEEELFFRGKQYAQAFLNFQKRQGRFPLKLEELMKTQPRSARKLFKEPMCDCDNWGLIRVGQPWPPPQTGTNPAGTSITTSGGIPSSSAGSPFFNNPQPTRPGSPVPGTFTIPPAGNATNAPGTGESSGTGSANAGNGMSFGGNAQGQDVSNAPIIGVYSKVHKKGLRTFHGLEYYDQWGFIAGANNDPEIPEMSLTNQSQFLNPNRSTSGSSSSPLPPPGT